MGSRHLANTKQHARNVSRRLILSYALDWLLIVIIAILGGIFHRIKSGNRRPFELQNPNIAFPNHHDTVTSTTLILLSLFFPAALSALICLVSPIVNAARSGNRAGPRNQPWKKALLELHHTWLGLFLALATAFMITEGLKDLAGKPRPHMLAVCRPDLSPSSISASQVGGLDQSYNSVTGATPILVSSKICSETDQAALRDAFASWPSGHSSFSMAGLVYLALFLCAKFYVRLPFVGTWIQRGARDWQAEDAGGASAADNEHVEAAIPLHERAPRKANGPDVHEASPTDDLAAARLDNNSEPPVYLVLLCLYVPVGLALFICVSRWFDFHHHGLDIFSGAIIGIICATTTFWWFYVLGGLGRKKTLRFGVGAVLAATSRRVPDWRAQHSRHSSEAAGDGLESRPQTVQVTRTHDWA